MQVYKLTNHGNGEVITEHPSLNGWSMLSIEQAPSLGLSSESVTKSILTIPAEYSHFAVWLHSQSAQSVNFMLLVVADQDLALKHKSTPEIKAHFKTVKDLESGLRAFVTQINRSLMKLSAEIGMGKEFYRAQAASHVVEFFLSSTNTTALSKAHKDLSDIEQFVRGYFIKAQKLNASDIHLISDGKQALLKMRVNKALCLIDKFEHSKAISFGNACYSTFNTADGMQSNAGTYVVTNHLEGEFIIPDTSLKGRFLSMYHGQGDRFNIVIRVIDKSKSVEARSFADLGMSAEACRALSALETISSGGLFVTGVTGAGKSRTLQNMVMNEIARCGGTKMVYALEQPIEQIVPGVVQISVDGELSKEQSNKSESQQMGFGVVNKKLMRGDPDTIMYGEVRDNISASAAYKGVDSGHLVYGTLHVDRALGAFGRLVDFGLPLHNVCRPDFLKMVIHQHLIAKICPHCSKPHRLGDPLPPRFSEEFVLGESFTVDEISKYAKISHSRGGHSILRIMQEDGRLKSKEVNSYREKLALLNSGSDPDAMTKRLTVLAKNSAIPESRINIRFKGTGCAHCFRGTVGVTPALEVLSPDNTLLDLIKNHELGKAELYWRNALGGRTIMEDMSNRVLTGVVDPWNTENELGRHIGA